MWRKNSWCLGIIVILCSSFVLASSVRINEIELNPEGSSDSGKEWVELYSETYVNLTNWKIMNTKEKNMTFNASFSGYYAINTSYQLLTDEDQKLYLLNSSNYIIDETDVISDKSNDDRTWSYCNEDWIFTNSTLGYENNCPNQSSVNECDWGVRIVSNNIFNYTNKFEFTIRVYNFFENKTKTNIIYSRLIKDIYGKIVKEYDNLNCTATYDKNCVTNKPILDYGTYLIESEIFPNCTDTDLENNFDSKLIIILPQELGQDYSKIKINELFPDPQGYDDAAMPDGEWVELYNSGDKSLDLENLSLKDNYGQDPDIFISDTNTIDGTVINPQGYLVIYMNGRSGFLNNDGFEKISLFKENNLLDEVSYSGSVEGLTWGKVDNIWKLTLPTPNSENFYNESVNESELEIDSTDKEEYKFGDIANVKIHVYKGNTNKYSIQAWIEKDDKVVSKRSKVSIFTKFTEYDVTLPIQIFSNCKEGYEEGSYEVIVEGFDLRDEEKVKIKGNNEDMCKAIKEEAVKEVSKSNLGLSEKDINASSSIEYISKEVKERKFAIYFFCVILIVMLIYFGLKNG